MKIITAVFNYPGRDKYERCLRALSNSIERTNPEAELKVLRLGPPPPIEGALQGWVSNHVKLEAFANEVLDDNTIFVDADTVFLRTADSLFDKDFDIAIGRRNGGKVPYNGGVVLAKPTPAARQFIDMWLGTDKVMLHNQKFHQEWRAKYNGQNQASFGYMIETYPDLINLYEYPTSVINAVEQDWPRMYDIDPVILHVRKKLLGYAISDMPINEVPRQLRKPVQIWRELEDDK